MYFRSLNLVFSLVNIMLLNSLKIFAFIFGVKITFTYICVLYDFIQCIKYFISMKVTYQESKTKEFIDLSTGEHLQSETNKTTVIKTTRPKFIMVFLENLSGMLSIGGETELHVLACIWEMSGYDTGEISLVKTIKERISDQTGINYRNVENAITRLTKKELIIRLGPALYTLNPNFFWKGEEIKRSAIIKQIVEFQILENVNPQNIK